MMKYNKLTKICKNPNCKKPFEASPDSALYCSISCRKAASREKNNKYMRKWNKKNKKG